MATASDSFALFLNSLGSDLAGSRNNYAALGGLCAVTAGCYALYKLSRAVYTHFGGVRSVRHRLRSYGQWAVVTGCTSGIGLEFARQLAGLGFDIVLMGRSEVALLALAEELEEVHKVRTVRVAVDFNQGPHIYDDLAEVLKDKDIGILVNNVGVMYDYPQYFTSVSEEKLWQILYVNCAAATVLTHLVLRLSMVPKKQGLVVTMSSSSGFQPTPQVSCYSASKKYLSCLSRSLNAEYAPLGVDMQSLVPFYIATGMTAYSPMIGRPGLLSPSPATYVRHALWTFGMTSETTGYFPHTVQLMFANLVPEPVWIFFSRFLMNYFRNEAKKSQV